MPLVLPLAGQNSSTAAPEQVVAGFAGAVQLVVEVIPLPLVPPAEPDETPVPLLQHVVCPFDETAQLVPFDVEGGVVGQVNVQLGPVRPTYVPSEHNSASAGQMVEPEEGGAVIPLLGAHGELTVQGAGIPLLGVQGEELVHGEGAGMPLLGAHGELTVQGAGMPVVPFTWPL
jgi:hypothetical protein